MSDTLNQAKSYYNTLYPKLLLIDTTDVSETGNEDITAEDIHKIIDATEKLVMEKGSAITPSQLRNIFAAVKEVEGEHLEQLALLRPRLAYISARQKNREAKIITELIGDLIKNANTPRGLHSLQTLMEMMVAYHKLYHS